MFTVLLLLLLPAQFVNPSDDARADPARDLFFLKAQEDWVHDVVQPKTWETVLSPPSHADLIRALSCPRHGCRQIATAALRALGPTAARTLAWGMHARDPETRDRCEQLWQLLFLCPHCGGVGECPGLAVCPDRNCRWPRRFDGELNDWVRSCGRCDGSGDLRTLLAPPGE